ncbi:MAG: hypothetical protein K8U03_10485 [Planctomycetia bacterium]|nr:hypothetical protein [Planctomycetia bacterium]
MLAISLALLVVTTTALGCAHDKVRSGATSRSDYTYELSPVARGKIAIEPGVAASEVESISPPSNEYVTLSAAECQCLAARHSMLGNLLDGEKNAVCCDDVKHCQKASHHALQRIKTAAAREARNKSSADALKLYFGLAEVEAGLDSIEATAVVIDDILAKAGEIKRNELQVPFDRTEFERQRMTLDSERTDLEAKRVTMNAQLHALLGPTSSPNAFFWPSDPLRPTTSPPDVETEVGYALATRPELIALRSLAADGTTPTDAIAELLGSTHGLLGLKAKFATLKISKALGGGSDCEPCARQNQLADLLRSREEQIAGDVRAAAFTVNARRRQASLAERQVASWDVRIAQLEELHTTGQASFLEIDAARIKRIEAQQAVVSAVTAWKRAEVELHQHEGALEAECRGL